MLNTFDLYDLHAVLINIRAYPNYRLNKDNETWEICVRHLSFLVWNILYIFYLQLQYLLRVCGF